MDFNEYQKLAMTTRNKDINQKDMLINSVMGLNGEERVFTVSQLCPYPFSDDDLK